MKIHAHIDNPVLKNFDDWQELNAKVKEIDPQLDAIVIQPTKVIITRMGRKTFPFGANPSIDWIVSKVKYMNDNDM